MPRKLALITYNIVEPDDPEEYAEWIREHDYPAFRQNPNILEYSCFNIVQNVQGTEWFKRYDLMFVEEHDLGGILTDPIIHEHAMKFADTWYADKGKSPDQSINYRVSYAEEIWG